jgi:serine/threonine-protein phosphatase 4 regulatory subunit 1
MLIKLQAGPLEEETKTAFVREVERIGRDQIYWVRREASFALGALAKIVPEEVVLCSLVYLSRGFISATSLTTLLVRL